MFSEKIEKIANEYSIDRNTTLFKYITLKTKAVNKGSKARRSLGNLYALYVLSETYLEGKLDGDNFTTLLNRMRDMPFGSKLQNHPLDNRVNGEIPKINPNCSQTMLPVQKDTFNSKKVRKISIEFLSENGMDPTKSAQFIIKVIDDYIKSIMTFQNDLINNIQNAETEEELNNYIEETFCYKSDARLFEVSSFAILHIHYKNQTIFLDNKMVPLILYKTGRTNANDGGIDFVLKPLGKFFQVTESLDFKKYFLDIDKTNKFPFTFVIKTEKSINDVVGEIRGKAMKTYNNEDIVNKYMSLFEEIFTVNELRNILKYIYTLPRAVEQLKTIMVHSFQLEYGLLD